MHTIIATTTVPVTADHDDYENKTLYHPVIEGTNLGDYIHLDPEDHPFTHLNRCRLPHPVHFTWTRPNIKDMTALFGEEIITTIGVDKNVSALFTLDVESMTCEIMLVDITAVPSIYVLVSGYGTDGGFGDYAPPNYSDPITVEDSLVFFTDIDSATDVKNALNKAADEVFYQKERDSYDGVFGMEYEIMSIPGVVPQGHPWNVKDAIRILTEIDTPNWYV